MMKKTLILASVIALVFPLILTGCSDRAEQQAEVKRLQTELTSAKAASEKIKKERDELMTQVKTRTEERDALQKKVDELDQQTTSRDQLRKQVADLTGERGGYEKQLAKATQERDALQTRLTEQTRTITTLQQEIDALAKSRETAVAETQRAQAKIEDLTTKLGAATTKVGELQEQLQNAAVPVEEGIEAPPIEAIESPIIRSFTTTRPRIYSGQKSTLSWWVTDADSVRIEPNIGSVGALGSRTIAPTKTTTYTLIATNENGESSVTRRIEVQ
jgi:uncharacterized phage infection (PIP) family protein YhgE